MPVKNIQIKAGIMSLHFIEDQVAVAPHKSPFSNLRIRCREATIFDCTCFIRPGVEISVPSTSGNGAELVDAEISSVERKPHESGCKCRFSVKNFQPNQKRTLNSETRIVQIHEIYILQKLGNPCENTCYRWDLSQDSSSIEKSKLSIGKFASDLSWLVVTSTLLHVWYTVMSMEKKIVYQAIDDEVAQNSSTNAISFQIKCETSVPIVVPASRDYFGLYKDDPVTFSGILDLRRSKRRKLQPDRYVGVANKPVPYVIIIEDSTDSSECGEVRECGKVGECNEREILQSCGRSLHLDEDNIRDQKHNAHMHRSSKKINLPLNKNSKQEGMKPIRKSLKRSYFVDENIMHRGRSRKSLRRSYSFTPFRRERSYGVTYRRKPAANAYAELMKKFVESMKLTADDQNPIVKDRWKDILSSSSSNKIQSTQSLATDNAKNEPSEIDLLWKEMELCMQSSYLSAQDESSRFKFSAEMQNSRNLCAKARDHSYTLDEEIGIVCKRCGFVSMEIKYILPPFMRYRGCIWRNNEFSSTQESEGNPWTSKDMKFSFNTADHKSTSIKEDAKVWVLISDYKGKLRCHQKKAFEFLWNNITGSLEPSLMDSTMRTAGGCVVSHSPGAGKTLLVITFLISYLKLFPNIRPLVLAPKTTLYTWSKEIIKWEVPVPVYQIHGCRTYRSDLSIREWEGAFGVSLGDRKPRGDVRHALHCLDNIRKWHSHPSILLMGYTSFQVLTREDSRYAHRRYMGQILKESTGILVLDEGHNPRSTKSRLRKALMKVKTNLRILLSGTLFQNNFGEYFNTLCLARPIFIDEVLAELDPAYLKNKKGLKQSTLETQARKCFVVNIANRINSDKAEERIQGLDMLRSMTGRFIDMYDGESDDLHGLHCYTLLIKPTALQSNILGRLQKRMDEHRRYLMEIEILITLGSIHPTLIRSVSRACKFLCMEELTLLEEHKFDLCKQPKVKFVVNLVHRSVVKMEKVLIFCHNLAPLNLLVEIFMWVFSWRINEEVLILSGEMELFERGRVIERFEDSYSSSRVMLASISACAEGISLTAASRVILLDTLWNPSKRKQAIARAYRPGQQRAVYVYQLLLSGTVEETKYRMTNYKEWVSSLIFSDDLVQDPSCYRAEKIEDDLLREIVEEDGGKSIHNIMRNEKASHLFAR